MPKIIDHIESGSRYFALILLNMPLPFTSH
jgi:hypothetical protein